MKRDSRWQRLGKFILEVIAKGSPIVLVVYLAVTHLDLAKFQSWYFGLILGTVLSVWASLWWLDHKIDTVRETVSGTGHLKIRVLKPSEVVPTIAWLYRTTGS